jgi:RNA polymerase sigma-70 factor (ECF subfamily)
MYESIQKLNPIDKALIFYYLEDFSGKEMAEQMGISEGNARVKLNRAKEKLKELINKRLREHQPDSQQLSSDQLSTITIKDMDLDNLKSLWNKEDVSETPKSLLKDKKKYICLWKKSEKICAMNFGQPLFFYQ